MIPLILYGRKRLFSMINEHPTIFEIVTEKKPIKDKPTVDSGSKSRGSTKVSVVFVCVVSLSLSLGRIKVCWFILKGLILLCLCILKVCNESGDINVIKSFKAIPLFSDFGVHFPNETQINYNKMFNLFVYLLAKSYLHLRVSGY